MVFVHSPITHSDNSLRAAQSDVDIDHYIKNYNDIKSTLCKTCMDGCESMLRKLKKCDDTDRCGFIRNEILVPSTKQSCSYLSESCNDNLDSTLKTLYDAGALADDPELVKEIDLKIKELTKLKHTINGVISSSHIIPKSGSKAGILDNTPSKIAKIPQNNDTELEAEVATV
ncbi:hypothetical protein MACK_002442 [Theileria orientalis]|uniref:Uncharacterized protein n=1 Tax=Theileria orientalis TaxID=68886 RepID=A0A976QUB6_THEOR|nr:hypothetical protein MACK_002442 [Theileria orientalis]